MLVEANATAERNISKCRLSIWEMTACFDFNMFALYLRCKRNDGKRRRDGRREVDGGTIYQINGVVLSLVTRRRSVPESWLIAVSSMQTKQRQKAPRRKKESRHGGTIYRIRRNVISCDKTIRCKILNFPLDEIWPWRYGPGGARESRTGHQTPPTFDVCFDYGAESSMER